MKKELQLKERVRCCEWYWESEKLRLRQERGNVPGRLNARLYINIPFKFVDAHSRSPSVLTSQLDNRRVGLRLQDPTILRL